MAEAGAAVDAFLVSDGHGVGGGIADEEYFFSSAG